MRALRLIRCSGPAGLLVVLALTGCAGSTVEAGSTPAPLAPASPGPPPPASPEPAPASPEPASPRPGVAADGGSYPTPEAVIEAIVAAGLTCEEPMSGTVEGVSAASSCILGGTEDAIVVRFASDAERSSFVEGKDPLASVVVGQDWAVQTVLLDSARSVASALGGEVVPGAG